MPSTTSYRLLTFTKMGSFINLGCPNLTVSLAFRVMNIVLTVNILNKTNEDNHVVVRAITLPQSRFDTLAHVKLDPLSVKTLVQTHWTLAGVGSFRSLLAVPTQLSSALDMTDQITV